jgi:hypothetical protein
MDVRRIVLELRYELQRIDEAIRSLEQLASGSRPRPAGPPKRLSAVAPRKNRQEIGSKSADSRTMNAASRS